MRINLILFKMSKKETEVLRNTSSERLKKALSILCNSVRDTLKALQGKPSSLDELALQIRGVRNSLAEVKVLSGFLPICGQCKKIRDKDNKDDWHQLENYLDKHSEAKVSTTYCPDCAKKTLEESEITTE